MVIVAVAGLASAAPDHTAGFVRYARVDRSDGAYREMLVDESTLARLRDGGAIAEGATILMESYYSPGEIGSVFVKRFGDDRWVYGSSRPGQPLPSLRAAPQCSGCHTAAEATGGTFTRAMLERFAASGEVQRILCNRSGRTPCEPEVYSSEIRR